MSVSEAAEKILARVRGDVRFLSARELAERDFAGFFAWLKEKGVAHPYDFFPKEAFGMWRFQEYFSAYVREQGEKAKAEQQRSGLIQVLKDPATAKGAIISAVASWPKDQQRDLVQLLIPPSEWIHLAPSAPIPDEPSADVQADVDKLEVPAP